MAQKRGRRDGKSKGKKQGAKALVPAEVRRAARRQFLKTAIAQGVIGYAVTKVFDSASRLFPGTQQPVVHKITVGDTLSLKEDVTIVLDRAVMTLTGQLPVVREG